MRWSAIPTVRWGCSSPPIWWCWRCSRSEPVATKRDRVNQLRPRPRPGLQSECNEGESMKQAMRYLMPVAAIAVLALAGTARAREYFVGGPVQKNDMEIVANYLIGIEMAPMAPNMAHGSDVIPLEADVHATADNIYGYPDGA